MQHDQWNSWPDVASLHDTGEHFTLLQPRRLQVNVCKGFGPGAERTGSPTARLRGLFLLRSLELVYERDGDMQGLPLYRFVAPKTMFANGHDYAPNEGFCPCRQSGLLNVSSCRFGESAVLPSDWGCGSMPSSSLELYVEINVDSSRLIPMGHFGHFCP